MGDILEGIRFFEHYPEKSSCFLCGTSKDEPCILIGVDGTGDGRIEQAEPIHLKCLLVGENWRINRGLKIIYGIRKENLMSLTKIEDYDICGLCGQPGADKLAHQVYWPGEKRSDGRLVHASCEDEECSRAHSLLTDKQRESFLRSI